MSSNSFLRRQATVFEKLVRQLHLDFAVHLFPIAPALAGKPSIEERTVKTSQQGECVLNALSGPVM